MALFTSSAQIAVPLDTSPITVRLLDFMRLILNKSNSFFLLNFDVWFKTYYFEMYVKEVSYAHHLY